MGSFYDEHFFCTECKRRVFDINPQPTRCPYCAAKGHLVYVPGRPAPISKAAQLILPFGWQTEH
jgi:DNA-directed RNA polymerase subunit RPC12/RpoP